MTDIVDDIVVSRFGHHPDPANDFCVEVEVIDGMVYDHEMQIGDLDFEALEDRIVRAMHFRVGGDGISVQAKSFLRRAEARFLRLRPSFGVPEPEGQIFAWSPRWTCFHCNESFTNKNDAENHFGLNDRDVPACIEILTEGEKAIVSASRYWQQRAEKAEAKVETLQYQNYMGQYGWRLFGKAKDRTEAKDNWESMEGRALAAEAAIDAAPRWLRSLLRWRAEKIEMARIRARKAFRDKVQALARSR